MNKFTDFFGWVSSNFFYITIAVLTLLYVRWFSLNPIMFGAGEQASAPLIFGLMLLLIYIFSVGMLKLLQHHLFIRSFFFAIAIFFLATNAALTFFYLPRLRASARFGNATYYITSNLPFFECCGYFQFTKWDGMFHYESDFYKYYMPEVKFSYDETTDEVSLINLSSDSERLYATFGKSRRSYEGYAKLGNHTYYSSPRCNLNREGICETWTYSLYQCALDNTLCSPLPMEYTTEMDGWGDLQANELTKEVDFYFDPDYSKDDILIYTYGESPRCFVEGCSLTK